MSVAKPLIQTVTNYLDETGTTEPVEMVKIRARVRGFLEKIDFEAGAEVERDQLLYLIQQREFQAKTVAAGATVKASQAELDRAEIEYARQQKLFKDSATSEVKLVQAKADRDAAIATLDAAKADLDQAQLDLDYTEVKSPISGRVGKTLVKAGNLVGDNEATHLTTVVKYDPIYANFNISERALLEVRARAPEDRKTDRVKERKLKIYLRRATDKGYPFEGHLDYADLAVDQSTGTYMVRGIFPNPDRQILPGLFVRVRIPIGTTEGAVLIPERAVSADQAGRYVLILGSDNVVERRDIEPGAKYDNLIVVNDGLDGDEQVVVDGIQRARPGAPVTPTTIVLKAVEGGLTNVQEGNPLPVEEQDIPLKKPADPALEPLSGGEETADP